MASAMTGISPVTNLQVAVSGLNDTATLLTKRDQTINTNELSQQLFLEGKANASDLAAI